MRPVSSSVMILAIVLLFLCRHGQATISPLCSMVSQGNTWYNLTDSTLINSGLSTIPSGYSALLFNPCSNTVSCRLASSVSTASTSSTSNASPAVAVSTVNVWACLKGIQPNFDIAVCATAPQGTFISATLPMLGAKFTCNNGDGAQQTGLVTCGPDGFGFVAQTTGSGTGKVDIDLPALAYCQTNSN